jgi:hypothetical protein
VGEKGGRPRQEPGDRLSRHGLFVRRCPSCFDLALAFEYTSLEFEVGEPIARLGRFCEPDDGLGGERFFVAQAAGESKRASPTRPFPWRRPRYNIN